MKTKEQIIAELKTQNPTIQIGSEEIGYTQLNQDEYIVMIEQWADNVIAKEEQEAKAEADKAAAQAKLAALGLTADDLKALGL
jgi:uncharacterized protein YfdQ (DUF2303 family)